MGKYDVIKEYITRGVVINISDLIAGGSCEASVSLMYMVK